MQITDELREDPASVTFPCIRVRQPIGEFYSGSITAQDLVRLTFVDVRRVEGEGREIETYLGIQRPLDKKRVKDLQQYVKQVDACFPSAVILAVSSKSAAFDEDGQQMTLSNFFDEDDSSNNIIMGEIAKVLDGQHRIEGLREYQTGNFQVNVSIFIDMDIAEQAYVFSTVNLAQTKVNKSLVYDLYDLAESRSPQKLSHNIAVALDAHSESPFYKRIKRLGSATPGRMNETITQQTFVESFLRYMSSNPNKDRDAYMRGSKPISEDDHDSKKFFLRPFLLEERDLDLTDVIWNYFDAVKQRWPVAWEATGKGLILNKTNGFRALSRFMKNSYLHINGPGEVPTVEQFTEIFQRIELNDDDFNTDRYKPGSAGEGDLYRELVEKSKLT